MAHEVQTSVRMRHLLALALIGSLSVTACATEDVIEDDQMDGGDGKSDGSPNVTFSSARRCSNFCTLSRLVGIVPPSVSGYRCRITA